jgi:hypothetical protein
VLQATTVKRAIIPGAVAAVFALAAAGPTYAAKKSKTEEGVPRGQPAPAKYNEIERGLWFAVEAAPVFHVDWVTTLPPTNIPRQLFPDDLGPGIRAGFRAGYDVMSLFSVDGYAVGQFRDMRIRRGKSWTGDLADLNAGVGLRLMPVKLLDSRLFFTGRLALGGAFLMPGEVARARSNPTCPLIPDGKMVVTDLNPACFYLPGIKLPDNPAGVQPFPSHVIFVSPTSEVMLGLEYFTKLRHFSVGADLAVGVVAWPFALHTALVPHVKYSL